MSTRPTSASAPAPAPAPAPAAAPATAWVQVFQEGQQQTMEALLAFQKSLADAHTAYLSAFESTSQALVAAIAGRPVTMASAMSFGQRDLNSSQKRSSGHCSILSVSSH